MGRYILKRILYLIPVMFGVLVLVFALKAVTPGDPTYELLPATATEEDREALREELHLNDSLPVQFVNYVAGVLKGDLGTSYKTKQSVTTELLQRLPKTFFVAIVSLIIGQLIANPLGIFAAIKQNTWIDGLIVFFSMVGASLPNFWLALMLIQVFSVNLHWLPSKYDGSGLGWILPIAVVAIGSIAATVRGVRTNMLEVIRQDYIRTARAKGQKEWIVILNHGFRNTLIPVITGLGSGLGAQLGGALIVETVFSVPGIGKYVADAVTQRNYPALQGGIIMLAFLYSIINILVDVGYTVVDPRLKTNLVNAKKKKTPSEEGRK